MLDDIRRATADEGKLVLVLISGFLMFGKKVPHWVLAIGDDGDHILIHDPWVEDERRGDHPMPPTFRCPTPSS